MADEIDKNYLEPEDQIDDEPVNFNDDEVEDDYIEQRDQIPQGRSQVEKKEGVEEQEGGDKSDLDRNPGQTRSPDPQERDKVDPNKTTGNRQTVNVSRESDVANYGDENNQNRLSSFADNYNTARRVSTNPAEAVKDKLADEAKKEGGKLASQVAKKSGQLLAQAGKALAQAVTKAATSVMTWLIGALGPWGVLILAIAIVIGIAVVLLTKNDSASDVQLIDMNKPSMVAAIERLSALSGDPEALNNLIKQETTDLPTLIDKTRIEAAKAPLNVEITAELDRAATLLQQIRASGRNTTTAEQTQKVNAMIYSLQRVSSLFRGLSITTAEELVTRANTELAASSGWIYSTNQNINDRTKPMRDGTNTVDNKKGCNSTGFITYLLRGDNTSCAECISPTLDKLSTTFSTLKSIKLTGLQGGVDYKKGDILAFQVENKANLEGYIVSSAVDNNGDRDIEVIYCGTSGPTKDNLINVLAGQQVGRDGDGKRTPLLQVQFRSASVVEATAGGNQ